MNFWGIRRFCADIRAMLGFEPGFYWRLALPFLSLRIWHFLFSICWTVGAPLFLIVRQWFISHLIAPIKLSICPPPQLGNDSKQFHQPAAPSVPRLRLSSVGQFFGHCFCPFVSFGHSIGRTLANGKSKGSNFWRGANFTLWDIKFMTALTEIFRDFWT